ncbi:hypothetical protein FACS189499_03270 [Clostridia bacterium]|nr:hypothetical protein FACS189499_03270 [Clostridia bacterium]
MVLSSYKGRKNKVATARSANPKTRKDIKVQHRKKRKGGKKEQEHFLSQEERTSTLSAKNHLPQQSIGDSPNPAEIRH